MMGNIGAYHDGYCYNALTLADLTLDCTVIGSAQKPMVVRSADIAKNLVWSSCTSITMPNFGGTGNCYNPAGDGKPYSWKISKENLASYKTMPGLTVEADLEANVAAGNDVFLQAEYADPWQDCDFKVKILTNKTGTVVGPIGYPVILGCERKASCPAGKTFAGFSMTADPTGCYSSGGGFAIGAEVIDGVCCVPACA